MRRFATKKNVNVTPRLQWFHDVKFGLFVHWGIYSILGRNGAEWVLYSEKIPIPEYEKLVSRFNPTEFNADEWVDLARTAGMKYITFTSRHCDGFCMFDTELTDFNSMNAPAGRDFVAELVEACHDKGIKICLYFCLWDWHHPDRVEIGGPRMYPPYEYVKGMLRELCTNYGKIDGIWFDVGYQTKSLEESGVWKRAELVEMIRALQPGIIINDRSGIPEDYATPEQYIPEAPLYGEDGKPRLWESCMTINDHWGYNKDDCNYKSLSQLIHHLVDAVSKGGNLLLNVGPMPNGKIQPEFIERLSEIGAWMEINGESIYGTRVCPEVQFPYGRCTTKGNNIFFHVFVWPGTKLKIHLRNKAKRAFFLGDGLAINCEESGENLVLNLPRLMPDPIDTVIVLEKGG